MAKRTRKKPVPKVRRIIVVAEGKQVGLGAYVRAIRIAKANPDETFKEGLTSCWPSTGREIMRDFMAGLHDRINQGIPFMQRGLIEPPPRRLGRRERPEYQIALWRDSRRVRDILQRRIRVYQFETDEARSRFGHLLAHYDD